MWMGAAAALDSDLFPSPLVKTASSPRNTTNNHHCSLSIEDPSQYRPDDGPMLRTRRPSAVTLTPSPKPTSRGRLPSELPVYSLYLERANSDEAETSSSSSSSSSEDVGEQAFNCRIQESFPLCRKNPQKEAAERRKAFLVRSLLILFAFCIVFANWNYLFPAKRQNNSNPIVAPRDVPTGRKLTTETENARSLDTMANQSQIRRDSEMKVLQKFGEGPYLVEFELRVWGDDNRPAKYFFTMELAPTVCAVFAIQLTFLAKVSGYLTLSFASL
jgi:hypothetical protein